MLQKETVTTETLALIQKLMTDSRLNSFVLAGGTALALMQGHRLSVDIDLFTDRPFDAQKLLAILTEDYNAVRGKIHKNGLICYIEEIKIDLVRHEYPLLAPPLEEEGIRLMSEKDLAAMKLYATIYSGIRVKDFVDISFMLQKMPLSEMYHAYEEKYGPDVSWQTARLALLDYKNISHDDEVLLTRGKYQWPKIEKRLRQAVEFPDRLLPPLGEARIKSPTKKTANRTQRRGRRL